MKTNVVTLDVNPTHGLALVMHEDEGQSASGSKYELIKLDDAPPMPDTPAMAPIYIRQAHYVVSHVVIGLSIGDLPVPKDGWIYKK